MTREQAIHELSTIFGFGFYNERVDEAVNMAIKALEQIESGRYVKGECRMCSKEYGTLGCCTTVSNHWVYSCKEGMAQYAEALEQEPSREERIIRCRNCRHDNNCEIQYSAQAGNEFFCGSAEGREQSRATDKWIPVSERLPEEDEEVLVTVYFKGIKTIGSTGVEGIPPCYYVEVAKHIGGEWGSMSDEYKVALNRHVVIAWQPLPEPHKGE